MPGPVKNPSEAYQQLEAIMLRQMLQSSGAFKAGTTPGAQLQADLFVETLADAVAKAGGLGIAKMLERQIGGTGAAGAPGAPGADTASAGVAGAGTAGALSSLSSLSLGDRHRAGHIAPLAPRVSGSGVATMGSTVSGAVDDLDDPNSEAPLPEDPTAPSIDDYQLETARAAARRGGAAADIGASPGASAAATTAHLHIGEPRSDHPSDATSAILPRHFTRALNRYRERAEDMFAGTPSSAGNRDKP